MGLISDMVAQKQSIQMSGHFNHAKEAKASCREQTFDIADLQELLKRTWIGAKGEQYSLKSLSETSWTCIRTGPKGYEKEFTLWLDKSTGYVWWGSWSYYFDPADSCNTDTISWSSRSGIKSAFKWQSSQPEIVEEESDASTKCEEQDEDDDRSLLQEELLKHLQVRQQEVEESLRNKEGLGLGKLASSVPVPTIEVEEVENDPYHSFKAPPGLVPPPGIFFPSQAPPTPSTAPSTPGVQRRSVAGLRAKGLGVLIALGQAPHLNLTPSFSQRPHYKRTPLLDALALECPHRR
jgi:hypothetical protein